LRGHLFGVGHDRVDVWSHEVSKSLRRRDDLVEYLFLFRLEWQTRNLTLPFDQVFKLGASCITGNLDPVVTDRASIVVVLFDLAPSYLKALAMIPAVN
jgi:hypothetical protein